MYYSSSRGICYRNQMVVLSMCTSPKADMKVQGYRLQVRRRSAVTLGRCRSELSYELSSFRCLVSPVIKVRLALTLWTSHSSPPRLHTGLLKHISASMNVSCAFIKLLNIREQARRMLLLQAMSRFSCSLRSLSRLSLLTPLFRSCA